MRNKRIKKKRFQERQFKRVFLYQVKRKIYLKGLRKKREPEIIKRRKSLRFISNPLKAEHERCIAPEVFSLIKNPDAVINYFDHARQVLAKGTPVYFDLSNITEMGPETLTYLCAILDNDEFINGNAIHGNLPNNPSLQKMFSKAGFYKFVNPIYQRIQKSTDVNGEIHKITREKVEPMLAGEICESAMIHTFDKIDPKDQSFYRILIECMANTKNHANYGKRNEVYNWWLLAYKEADTKITKFCFLDLGVGIFGSLEKKYRENKLPSFLKRIFVPKNNKKTLQKIYEGERKTSTEGLEGRGQGLNYVYDLVKKDATICNFTLLSNDIIAHFGYNAEDTIEPQGNDFVGTMYYWEISPNYEKN